MKNLKIIIVVLTVYSVLSTGYFLTSSVSASTGDVVSRSEHDAVVARLEERIKDLQESARAIKAKGDREERALLEAAQEAKNHKPSGETFNPLNW